MNSEAKQDQCFHSQAAATMESKQAVDENDHS